MAALATGNKYLRDDGTLPCVDDGTRIIHSHAEVLARRAFVLYLRCGILGRERTGALLVTLGSRADAKRVGGISFTR